MKINIPGLLILICAICFMYSCKHEIPVTTTPGGNDSSIVITCDSSKFEYAATIKPVLQTYCYNCHSGNAADGGSIQLDTYAVLKRQVISGKLYKSITHTGPNPMPKNGNKLSDCTIAIIRKWIEVGAPDN